MWASQWTLFISLGGGWGCPGVRKRRREGRRKPLLCVLFLVREMERLLGANKGPFETCFSLTHGGHLPFSCLLPS